MNEKKMSDGITHYDGCWQDRHHHGCAMARIAALDAEMVELRSQLNRATECLGRYIKAEAIEMRKEIAAWAARDTPTQPTGEEKAVETPEDLWGVDSLTLVKRIVETEKHVTTLTLEVAELEATQMDIACAMANTIPFATISLIQRQVEQARATRLAQSAKQTAEFKEGAGAQE